MIQIFACIPVVFFFLLLYSVWGHSVAKWLHIKVPHVALQVLIGLFAFFIVMQAILIPVIFLRNDLTFATVLVCTGIAVVTAFMLWRHRLGFLENFKKISLSLWLLISCLGMLLLGMLAVLQQFMGYDTAYYIGQMTSFLYYGEFWTHNLFVGGGYDPVLPLHYALSCFYPLFAIAASVFHIEARIFALYMVRSLCVVLAAATMFSWGYQLFEGNKKRAHVFTILCLLISFFLVEDHSSSFMMMVRGYESKGYCAAVVAPMCTLALIQLCRDYRSVSAWRLLGLIAWASVPIAMSSLAVIPVAVAVVGLTLMVYHRNFRYIFLRCLLCVLPNLFWMVWYIWGSYGAELLGR